MTDEQQSQSRFRKLLGIGLFIYLQIAGALSAIAVLSFLGHFIQFDWRSTLSQIFGAWNSLVRPTATLVLDICVVTPLRHIGISIVISPALRDYIAAGVAFLACCVRAETKPVGLLARSWFVDTLDDWIGFLRFGLRANLREVPTSFMHLLFFIPLRILLLIAVPVLWVCSLIGWALWKLSTHDRDEALQSDLRSIARASSIELGYAGSVLRTAAWFSIVSLTRAAISFVLAVVIILFNLLFPIVMVAVMILLWPLGVLATLLLPTPVGVWAVAISARIATQMTDEEVIKLKQLVRSQRAARWGVAACTLIPMAYVFVALAVNYTILS
jgi:hypothetical protein